MSSSKKNASAGKQQHNQQSTKASSSASAAASSPVAAAAAGFTPLLPAAADLVPGASLRVTTSLGAAFDAILHCYDSTADLLVVEVSYGFDDDRAYHNRQEAPADLVAAEAAVKGEGRKDITILHAKQIRVELTSPAPSAARVLPPLSMTSIAAKVEANTQARQESVQFTGIGVAPEVQKLFDAIRRTYRCVWSPDFSSFVVSDSVRISPPFTGAACASIPAVAKKSPSLAAESLARIRKVVELERAKLG